jgi:hypothetical protein
MLVPLLVDMVVIPLDQKTTPGTGLLSLLELVMYRDHVCYRWCGAGGAGVKGHCEQLRAKAVLCDMLIERTREPDVGNECAVLEAGLPCHGLAPGDGTVARLILNSGSGQGMCKG